MKQMSGATYFAISIYDKSIEAAIGLPVRTLATGRPWEGLGLLAVELEPPLSADPVETHRQEQIDNLVRY
jgi:hypothetical protein